MVLTEKIKIYPTPFQRQQLESIEKSTKYLFKMATKTKQQEYQELLEKFGYEDDCFSMESFSQVVKLLEENANEEKSTLKNIKKYHVRKKSVYRHWGIFLSPIPKTLDFSTTLPLDDYYIFRNPKEYKAFCKEFKDVLGELTFTTRKVQKVKKKSELTEIEKEEYNQITTQYKLTAEWIASIGLPLKNVKKSFLFNLLRSKFGVAWDNFTKGNSGIPDFSRGCLLFGCEPHNQHVKIVEKNGTFCISGIWKKDFEIEDLKIAASKYKKSQTDIREFFQTASIRTVEITHDRRDSLPQRRCPSCNKWSTPGHPCRHCGCPDCRERRAAGECAYAQCDRYVIGSEPWYAHITYIPDDIVITHPTGPKCGIDPGVRVPYTVFTSDATHWKFNGIKDVHKNHKFNRTLPQLWKILDKLDDAKSKIQKGKKWNELTRVEKNKIWKINKKLRKLTKEVKLIQDTFVRYTLETHSVVYIEDTDSKGLLEKDGLSAVKRKIHDLRIRNVISDLEQRASRYGSSVIRVPSYGTSKLCSTCGFYNTSLTSEEYWTCPQCRTRHDRDRNAACNILNYEEKTLPALMEIPKIKKMIEGYWEKQSKKETKAKERKEKKEKKNQVRKEKLTEYRENKRKEKDLTLGSDSV